MTTFISKKTHITIRWAALLVALTAVTASLLQAANIGPVFADNGGYPWVGATCIDGTDCSGTYNWGYSLPCPQVDPSCTTYEYPNSQNPTAGMGDPWGYGVRNCTSYVAWKVNQQESADVHGWGQAYQWATNAPSNEVHAASGYTPQVGDIAQWNATGSNQYGHVAYVFAVNGSTASFYEYNSGYPKNGSSFQWGLFYSGFTSANYPAGGPNNYIHVGTVSTPANTVNWSGNFASTWGTNRLDTFTPETWSSGSANTDHKWFNSSWQSWDAPLSLGQQITSWPSAVSWGSNRIDLFARDATTSHHLLHAYYDTNGWHNWDSTLGGCITGAPAVSSWGTNRLDIFAQGCGDNGASLNHIWYDGSWHSWETIPISGGQLASAPAAVSWGSGRIDVFAQNYSDGALIQTYYDANGWHNWTEFSGSCITGAPGVSSWGTNRLDVFAQGCGDNGSNTNHIWFNGSWQPWETLPNSQQITSSPSAVSWSTNRIDVFARGASGDLKHRYYDTGGWHDWESLGGTLGS